ncbi:SDR family oxidoreductase [Bradyrhizobium yuanmingense]|uniref:SDR family oxidoreductase n=1 Tax=Bradyrhizobium yuanmingense TaxID=108015 RepID=UPI0021A5E303|nr:SDR family oxidoreductase [Bradyrhizobium sp. CB1024]UWU83211.1 SDR family oxidoreductase [Bradyrhizobium sp. CB1024]
MFGQLACFGRSSIGARPTVLRPPERFGRAPRPNGSTNRRSFDDLGCDHWPSRLCHRRVARSRRRSLTGTSNTCHFVVPFVLKKDSGRIINISCVAGKEGNPNIAVYSAT